MPLVAPEMTKITSAIRKISSETIRMPPEAPRQRQKAAKNALRASKNACRNISAQFCPAGSDCLRRCPGSDRPQNHFRAQKKRKGHKAARPIKNDSRDCKNDPLVIKKLLKMRKSEIEQQFIVFACCSHSQRPQKRLC